MDYPLPDVAAWAAGNRQHFKGVLADLGESPDLMQSDPVAALRRLEDELSFGWDPTVMSEEEGVRFKSFLMVSLAEFLISFHGARWDWLADASSPLGGRWVIVGLPHPLDQETFPVDVGRIANDAMSLNRVSLVSLINRAELESGMRVIS